MPTREIDLSRLLAFLESPRAKKNRRAQRARLMFAPPIDGQPPWALILSVEHLGLAYARDWDEMRGPGSLEREYKIGVEFLRRAKEDARADLEVLGHAPVTAAIDGYLAEIGSSYHYDFSDEALESEIKAKEDAAPAELLRLLPKQIGSSAGGPNSAEIILTDALFGRWRELLRSIVSVRLWHERAATLRPEYLRLAKAGRLPSDAIYLAELDRRLRALLGMEDSIPPATLNQMVGACVACASGWRLRRLGWELGVADLQAAPLGSHLSTSQGPKTLQVWHLLDARLRTLLGDSMADFAKSRVLTVALMVFAGSELAPITDIDSYARNVVEKYRKRMPPRLAKEARRQTAIEEQFLRSAVAPPDGRTQ